MAVIISIITILAIVVTIVLNILTDYKDEIWETIEFEEDAQWQKV